SGAASKLTELSSLREFNKFVGVPQLSVIDFYATWCGPCKAMSPILEKFASDFEAEGVKFGKVDVDQAQSIAAEYGVTGMPTFILLKDGAKVDKVVGAAPQKLLDAINSN
ncbi:hypothetical protein BABINDRAFT_29516, partial [Babjeviella inositovora NRRL Y-12698]